MSRIIISLSLLITLTAAPAFAQLQSSQPIDTTRTGTDTVAATSDSSIIRFVDGASRRPRPAAPIVIPKERSGICGSISTSRCAVYGALIGGSLGAWLGFGLSPQPEIHHGGLGDLLGAGYCTANCGVPHKAIVFALVGSGVGGLAGWLLGRK